MKVNVRYSLFTIILIICFSDTLNAQMFSVQSEQTTRRDAPDNNILLGFEPTSFTFRGDENANVLSFSDPVYQLRAELSGFQGYLALGYNLGDENSLNYLNAGAEIDGEYRFAGDRNYFMSIPLVLNTDYLQVGTQNDIDRSDHFRQSSAMVGLGFGFGVRLAGRLRIESRAVPFYGYSVTSFGASGGSRSSLSIQNRIYLDRLFDRIGITAGFDFRTSRYNMRDERFDYDITSNSFVIGVTF
ncbi:MAG: hypothetical protein WD625_10215 [Balneolales bacterium]